jgi:pimeloyl-ACP methyl ester carboxylesterase
MAKYVLVHGGGHGGWCYQPVARLMRAQGHEVYTPTLTGLGEREHLLSPAVDLETHITDVVKLLQFEDLSEVILVGHSYGGMVITGVADRSPGRIRNLVFLDAAMPQNGQSLVDHAGPMMLAARTRSRIVNGMELVLFPGEDPLNFFGVKDPGQIAWMKPKLTPHPWRCFDQKLVLKNEAAMRKVPVSVIVCSSHMNDEARAALKALSNGRFWEIDTGHDLMVTEPAAVAEMLLRLASV